MILPKLGKIRITKSYLPTVRSFALYAGSFALFVSAIGYSYHNSQNQNLQSMLTSNASAMQHDPSVDQITALQVAGGIADRADLPVAANIANLSTSLDVQNKISKPQVIAVKADSRSVTTYTTKDGDTLQSVAEQFNLSPQTIQWANNTTNETVEVGAKLTVPPVDGVIYTVKDGDTIQSIAEKYTADAKMIVTFNDLELTEIRKDQRIMLPDATLPVEERPDYVAPVTNANINSRGTNASVNGLVNGFTPITMSANGNAYAFGNCTSWAYERRAQLGHPVGSYWGNAATWDTLARSAGYIVDKTPTVGAVMQMPAFVDAYTGGYGHVAIVESVNGDGSINISEMNYAGNFNVVTYRTVPASQAALYNYIH